MERKGTPSAEEQEYIRWLERVVQNLDPEAAQEELNKEIKSLDDKIKDMEAHQGLPSAIRILKAKREMAIGAGERMWMTKR